MSTPREELHELVEVLPDEQVLAAVSDLRGRLASRGAAPVEPAWPPAWFGIAEGSTTDTSERVEEIFSVGLGHRGA